MSQDVLGGCEIRNGELSFGRINALRRLGERFIKVTYKDLGEELLMMSAVDKSD